MHILNEPADVLSVSINGGAPILLDGSSAGTKNFVLGSTNDTFSINTQKNAAVGYTIATGGTIAAAASGLSQTTNEGGFNLISNDSNVLNRFNSPRGVAVSNNPNATNFGTTYISNSATGTTTGVVRTLGDGMYAVRADQSDAFAYGDTAQDPSNRFDGAGASANSPFRVSVARSGDVYVADFSDANGNVYQLNPNLTSSAQLLNVVGGPTTVPPTQNHGSVTSVYVEGSSATGNLKLYTVDEDLAGNHFGAGHTGKNNLWQYDIDGSAVPFNGTPTRVNATGVLLTAATSDLDRGLVDDKWYLAQNRSVGAEAGVVVLSSDGQTVLFDSLSASRTLLGNPTANDILRNVLAMDVSDDQKWLAVMLNNSDVAVVPLLNGIPDLANRLIVNTGADINSGRDIAFDIAGNIHYASSGQGLYRVLAPGGFTDYTLSYDPSLPAGQQFTFVPEPSSIALLALGGMFLGRRRRT